MDHVCKFYVNGKFKLSCHSKHYNNNYIKLCERYGKNSISVERIFIGRRFNSKLDTLIKQLINNCFDR